MKRDVDGPVSQLILDLEERGLLDRTLVVLASRFGRDMMTEGKPGKGVLEQVKQPDVVQSEALRDASPFHGGFERPAVWRRHQTRVPLWQNG